MTLPQCQHCAAELPDHGHTATQARRRTIRQLQARMVEERRVHALQLLRLTDQLDRERAAHRQTGAEWRQWRERALAAERRAP